MSTRPAAPDALLVAIDAGDAARVAAFLDADPGLAGARDAAGLSVHLRALYAWEPAIAERIRALAPPADVPDATAAGDAARLAAVLAADPAAADAPTPDGFRPLHLAAYFGGPEVARLLLAAGADPRRPSANDVAASPLDSAIAARRTDVALLLLAAGADAVSPRRQGWTPLLAAAENGLPEVVEALLVAGADPRATLHDGRDAVALATARGHTALAGRLEAAAAGG